MSISAKERRETPDSEMGVPGKDKYPLRNPHEIKSANNLINNGDITPEEKKALARKIRRRAKEEGMDTSKLHAANKVAGVTEQVPPMSDGTSLGNSPPRTMAPYYDEAGEQLVQRLAATSSQMSAGVSPTTEEDELMSRMNQIGVAHAEAISKREMKAEPFQFAQKIVKEISVQVEKDSKPPTGNQNCQLCTWCAEARYRGINALPRPIYSPRDPALNIKGETIVMNPIKESFKSQKEVVRKVRGNVDSRWYVHVNWKDSTGGHEFLVINIDDYAYIMDTQAGLLKEIDELDSTHNYFRDINFKNSYMVRLDTRPFNTSLFNDVNNSANVMPWKNSLDIPYMRDNGMLAPGDDSDPRFRRVLVPSEEGLKYLKEDPGLSQYWEDMHKATNGEFLVDRDTGEAIGHVFVHIYKRDKGFIFNLEVNPKYRRQGYGWILIDDAVRRFGGEDLTVRCDNEPAVHLYLDYGFKIYKKGVWYDPPHEEYWMKYDRSKLTQESTNVFESGHFSKYKDDVLGFNDEGMAVMKKCDCGGTISIAMKGEPIYTCESCGKTYGCVPFQEGSVGKVIAGGIAIFALINIAIAIKDAIKAKRYEKNTPSDEKLLTSIEKFLNDYNNIEYKDFLTDTSIRWEYIHDSMSFVDDGLKTIVKYAAECIDKKSNCYKENEKSFKEFFIECKTTKVALWDILCKLDDHVKDYDVDEHCIDKTAMKYRKHYRSLLDQLLKQIEKFLKTLQKTINGEDVVQEGAFQDLKNGVNPYSDDLVFHVSMDKHIDGQVWKPRVPDYLDPYNPEDTGFEDNTTPRICFSTSIEGALNGITVNIQRQSADTFDKMYVYVPEKPWKEYKHKTNKQLVKNKLVYDANVTREVWIMEPVRMKLYGVIRVDQIADAKRKSVVPTSKGQKDTRNYFTYKWHWVVKPKVLKKATKFDYSPERVIDDLCIDIKKFKYGLIKDGRLMTGNVSDADYDKYWVFHSGEEVDQAGGGNCYDMVEYEAGYLEACSRRAG